MNQDYLISNDRLSQVTGGGDGDYYIYTVRSSDTLSTIASKYNTTVEILMQLNNISNPDLVRPGLRLKIPR